jgi:ABC-type transporter Mla subunit MlaD
MRRRGSGSIVANPILVGAVTVLVVTVAVFLAYNANNGLPFVPSRTVLVELPNGADITKGVEVREGGFRIGIVETLTPERRNGRVQALLRLKLDEASGPVPVDSRILVRPRSPLALKIVELDRGTSSRTVPEGGRIPLRQTRIATDLDELYSIYDRPTREGVRDNLVGFGGAFATRGADLNETITRLPDLFGVLAPVMRNLASPSSPKKRSRRVLGDFTRITAPVAEEWARTFTTMADTFDAITRDPGALAETIRRSPPTLEDSTRSFRVQRPFLRDTAALSVDLRAVAGDLRVALPPVNRALRVGTPVSLRSVELNETLRETLATVRDVTSTPTTNAALRGLTATVTTLQPQLRFLGPYVTVCNYWNIFWTFAAEHFSSPDPTGSTQRVLLNTGDRSQRDRVSGEMGAAPRPVEYLHANAYGAPAVTPNGEANCVAGQQGYAFGANTGDPTPDGFYRRAVTDQSNNLDPATAPRVGSTYREFDINGRGSGRNRDRVPAGQTFSDFPGGRADLTEYDRSILRRRGQQP